MSPEILFAIGTLIIVILGGIGALIKALIFLVQQFSEIKVETAKIKNDSEASDNAREAIVNEFVVDFNRRIQELQAKVEQLVKENVSLQVANAEYKGKLEILDGALNRNVEKIDKLSGQIAQLTHDKTSQAELIERLNKLNEGKDKQIAERDKQFAELQAKLSKCQEDKRLAILPKAKSEQTEQSDNDDNKAKDIPA